MDCYEPSYQTMSLSLKEAKQIFLNKPIIQFILYGENDQDNEFKILAKSLFPLIDCQTQLSIDRNKNNFYQSIENIINNELEANYPFGSLRGFVTFVEKPVYQNIIKNIILDICEYRKLI